MNMFDFVDTVNEVLSELQKSTVADVNFDVLSLDNKAMFVRVEYELGEYDGWDYGMSENVEFTLECSDDLLTLTFGDSHFTFDREGVEDLNCSLHDVLSDLFYEHFYAFRDVREPSGSEKKEMWAEVYGDEMYHSQF